MKTTIGNLVSEIFEQYRRAYQDDDLAALATEVAVCEIFAAASRQGRTGRRSRDAVRGSAAA